MVLSIAKNIILNNDHSMAGSVGGRGTGTLKLGKGKII
jgi:hypothetical protein